MKSYLYNLIFLLLFSTIFISCGSTSTINTLEYNYHADDTIYEDAEDGTTQRWVVRSGFPIENVEIGANGSERSIFLRENWYKDDDGNPINGANYELEMNNDYQFILEFDKMKQKAKVKHCFTVGVKLETKYGKRYLSFNTFYDKEGMEADSQWILDGSVKEIIFPLSMDYVNITNSWKHLRFDLNDYLHQFEPDNDIYVVETFYFQGGDDYLDNIRLVSE